MDPNAKSHYLKKLQQIDSELRSETSPEKIKKILETYPDVEFIALTAAKNPNTSSETLKSLFFNGNHVLQSFIVSNPQTPKDFLLELLEKNNVNTHIKAAVVNEHLEDWEKLSKLAKNPEYHIRKAVAENPYTGADTLSIIACDSSLDISHCVYQNPSFLPFLKALFDTTSFNPKPKNISDISDVKEAKPGNLNDIVACINYIKNNAQKTYYNHQMALRTFHVDTVQLNHTIENLMYRSELTRGNALFIKTWAEEKHGMQLSDAPTDLKTRKIHVKEHTSSEKTLGF